MYNCLVIVNEMGNISEKRGGEKREKIGREIERKMMSKPHFNGN